MTVNTGIEGEEGAGAGAGEGGAGGAQDWRTGIDEAFREHPSVTKFKSPTELVKSYLEQEKLVGKAKIALPTDEKDPAWNQVFEKLGRPKDPKEYQIPEMKDVDPEFIKTIPAEVIEDWKKTAHAQGLNQRQMQAVMAWHITRAYKDGLTNMESGKAAKEKAEAELRADLGAAFMERVNLSKRLFQNFSGEKDQSFFEEHGNDPRLIRFMANLGSKLSEDTLGPGLGKGFTQTPAEAQGEIDRILGDSAGPYFNADHPEHNAMVEKVGRLYKIAG